ncbi:hypothetical protein EHI8A_035740 [Entamoeba histolytica HM-1:IMSS-B]|nr:Hypothetical protein EHI5A_012790 [Entamoeba histolytica KU27]EMH77176.1 hypothetical protein EHI8A_035740 [Entamoeba histolytica HM-1:IMSS-B]EMS17916.1 hypothetical protein KM1_016110 [Entamoeba histolytica HM-3:IMSS]ENY64918.1 hypothetical protein EHI7A_005480 [Entamoeba histolytica HM-1:IMSS-A]GAT97387.1 hypothetical protein CL6EHI_044220 [Entamoeba histolytica]
MKSLVILLLVVSVLSQSQKFENMGTDNVLNVLSNLEADIRDIETTEAVIRGDIEYDRNLHQMHLTKYEQFQIKHELAFYRKQLKQTLKVKKVLAQRFINFLNKVPKKAVKIFEKKFNLPKRITLLKKWAQGQKLYIE